ncbi:spore coat protein [Paenibacillus sp. 1001270B_150601_E10]|uniref:spore coat protein n=1 Tax=Paenibacillus sp. 1001270B_150601_E10 TaxID=2787079 RepID=UPI0018A04820|nr:spore coat protein [Paenibacillus sp. 1001270B_150601_E10]
MNQADLQQRADEVIDNFQGSDEIIVIKDSCGVTVESTDTKIAATLQIALQAAIAIVVSISIADSDRAKSVTQELLQKVQVQQQTFQRTVIESSANVRVATTSTDVSLNIQALLQILLALVIKLDVF